MVKIREIKGVPVQIKRYKRKLEKAGQKFDDGFMRALYIDFMSDPINRVNPKAKAKFCQAYQCPKGLASQWANSKEVQVEIRTTVRERFGYGERIKELYDELWNQCRIGRISAIRLALELTGEYIPKMQHLDKPKSLEDLLTEMEKQMKVDRDDQDKTISLKH